jgi:fatty acid-binding protein DegV
MTMTSVTKDMATAMTGTTTIDMTRRFRIAALSSVVASTLQLTPVIAAETAGDGPQESSISTHAKSFGAAVKRDAKVVGAKCKEGAHRVAVAAKAVGHEVATAAKRGAAETRAAFRGEKAESPAS